MDSTVRLADQTTFKTKPYTARQINIAVFIISVTTKRMVVRDIELSNTSIEYTNVKCQKKKIS